MHLFQQVNYSGQGVSATCTKASKALLPLSNFLLLKAYLPNYYIIYCAQNLFPPFFLFFFYLV